MLALLEIYLFMLMIGPFFIFNFQPAFPYFTWGCAEDLEGRLKKSLYHGGKDDCMPAASPVALSGIKAQ